MMTSLIARVLLSPLQSMIRILRTSSVTFMLGDHPLEACLPLRSLTTVVLKTRVVPAALIGRT